jgi:hypothetical protein
LAELAAVEMRSPRRWVGNAIAFGTSEADRVSYVSWKSKGNKMIGDIG